MSVGFCPTCGSLICLEFPIHECRPKKNYGAEAGLCRCGHHKKRHYRERGTCRGPSTYPGGGFCDADCTRFARPKREG